MVNITIVFYHRTDQCANQFSSCGLHLEVKWTSVSYCERNIQESCENGPIAFALAETFEVFLPYVCTFQCVFHSPLLRKPLG